jgi:hypothetical protein
VISCHRNKEQARHGKRRNLSQASRPIRNKESIDQHVPSLRFLCCARRDPRLSGIPARCSSGTFDMLVSVYLCASCLPKEVSVVASRHHRRRFSAPPNDFQLPSAGTIRRLMSFPFSSPSAGFSPLTFRFPPSPVFCPASSHMNDIKTTTTDLCDDSYDGNLCLAER